VVPLDDRVSVAIAAYDPLADIIAKKPGLAEKRPTLRLWIEKERRNRRADIVPPQAKVAANYSSVMTAKARARAAGYDEILLIDEYGQVAEGPTTNLFMVDRAGALCTPPDLRVLLGVTRSTVLALAKADGIPIREGPILPEELESAAEVFLTGTSAGVWPVASIDDHMIGDGEPGPISRALGEHFERVVSGGDPAFDYWLTVVD
jgi:branched-chain amino acid aminotransferase